MIAKMTVKLFKLCELSKRYKMPEKLSKTPGPWRCVLLVSTPCSGVRRASLKPHHTGNDLPLGQGWSDHCTKVTRAVEWTTIIFLGKKCNVNPLTLVLIHLWGDGFCLLFARTCQKITRQGFGFISGEVHLSGTKLLHKQLNFCMPESKH